MRSATAPRTCASASAPAGAGEGLRFRKRPVEIVAWQLTADNCNDPARWPWWLLHAWQKPCEAKGAFFELAGAMLLQTLEGEMLVSENDWIIRGVQGELYPCKPDIFALTYEAVE